MGGAKRAARTQAPGCWQAMLLDSHRLPNAACWGFPKPLLNSSVPELAARFCETLWNTDSSSLPVFLFFFGFLFPGAERLVHIRLYGQQLPHFIAGLPVLAVGFLLFLQQLCILSL